MDFTQIGEPDYWRKLNPELSISEVLKKQSIALLSTNADAETRKKLISEGYIEFKSILSSETTLLLKEGVLSLRNLNYVPIFAFIYDEFWEVFYSLKKLISFVLGKNPKMLPDFWIWYVDPVKEESGWAPHRDKDLNTLMPDGMPKSATVWVSLTDATPLNGCIYLVPAYKDAGYLDFLKNSPPNDLQAARTLEVPAGSVLLWNQRVYHWGGQSSRNAQEPRISMAVEFQRDDIDPYNSPLIEMSSIPPFNLRLELIGQQILQYRHMYNYSEELAKIAKLMVGGSKT